MGAIPVAPIVTGWQLRRQIFVALVGFLLLGCNRGMPYEGKSLAQLEKMLADADPRVQAQGAHGLSRLGLEAKPAVPRLIEQLKNPQAFVRQQVAIALAKIGAGASEALPALIDASRDPEWTVRRQVALALAAIGPDDPAVGKALDQLARDPDSLVKQGARSGRKGK